MNRREKKKQSREKKETSTECSYITRRRQSQYTLRQLNGLPQPSFIDSPDTKVVLHTLLKSSHSEASTSDGDLRGFHPLFSIFRADL